MAHAAPTLSSYELERSKPVAVPVILALNFAVWAAWMFGFRVDPRVPGFLEDHFVVSHHIVDALGHWWTLLTAAFSHQIPFHFLINMLVLKSFGDPLERAWGTARFVTFYLCAAVASSIVHVGLSRFGWMDMRAVGASGAIAGVLMCFAFLYPRRLLLFFGVLPVPAWLGVIVFVGFDVWGLIQQREPGQGLPIGHGAHLGGAFFGLLWSLIDRSLGNDLEAYEEEALEQEALHRAGRDRPGGGGGAGPTIRRIQQRMAEVLKEAERQQRLDDARARDGRRGPRRGGEPADLPGLEGIELVDEGGEDPWAEHRDGPPRGRRRR